VVPKISFQSTGKKKKHLKIVQDKYTGTRQYKLSAALAEELEPVLNIPAPARAPAKK